MKSSELERKIGDRNTNVNGRDMRKIHLEELKRIQRASLVEERDERRGENEEQRCSEGRRSGTRLALSLLYI